jgi:hypothetical protein
MLADLLVVGVKQTMTKKLYNDNKSYSWNEWLETCMVGIHVQNTTMKKLLIDSVVFWF